ncbi:MAG: ribonuclease P protein component [Tenericutes bacterium]|jgi:ribonuclease P protein component|nr:ribonuclease P protein component [Bacilli bacterium]MDD3995885.1 ribonuclease P protein component [Bacilli bacterium]MDD4624301.1 ribonuclease P protein component [Bacilli bacterium]MDD4831489.1 ribonuclease P protein component [Bacilli bacterium]NLV89918.1 ribonuclease P protein component [Mycoplasmatota bacterium]
MKKINIVKSNKDFDNIIKNGLFINNKYFNVYYINNNNNIYRIGVSVPKKIGKAVIRNKLKRQVKNILDYNKEKIKTYDYIIMLRKSSLDIEYKEKEQELIKLLNKL